MLSSYIAWLSRFVRFHKQNPEKLDANDIANYMNYLAVNRMVASGTQRQALNAIIFITKIFLTNLLMILPTLLYRKNRPVCQWFFQAGN